MSSPAGSEDVDHSGSAPLSPGSHSSEFHHGNSPATYGHPLEVSTTTGSEVNSTISSSTSPYRRDRFDRLTRREAFHRKIQRAAAASSLKHTTESLEEKKLDDHDFLSRPQHMPQPIHSADDDGENGVCLSPKSQNDEEEPATSTNHFTAVHQPRSKRILRKRQLGGKHANSGNTTVTTETTAASSSSATAFRDHGPTGYTSLNGLCGSPRGLQYRIQEEEDDGDGGCGDSDSGGFASQPRNLQQQFSSIHNNTTADETVAATTTHEAYYRVVYRGVVALLTAPDSNAPRSGSYLGYGEVFQSKLEIPVDSDSTVGPTLTVGRDEREPGPSSSQRMPTTHAILDSPPRSIVSHHTAGSVSSLDTFQTRSTMSGPHTHHGNNTIPPLSPTYSHASSAVEAQPSSFMPQADDQQNRIIRVDRVLTGGYAMDGQQHDFETPKRSNNNNNNMDYYVPISGPLEEGIDMVHRPSDGLGFLFFRRKDLPIVEALDHIPQLEEGSFQYRVVSSTPLPIYAGPSFDAPKIKAMALPGTTHDISLRICVDGNQNTSGVWFLRLSHRRGWVADRKRSRKNYPGSRWATVMREVFHGDDGSCAADDLSAVSSVASSSAMTPTAAGARRRHRPPRKRRDAASKDNPEKPPRHIGKGLSTGMSTPVKLAPRSMDHHNRTPSSTVSILSDDSSLDRSSVARNGSAPTSPDYSQTSGATSNVSSLTATPQLSQFYLMRVTAPRGLKILDTPQFQVNNLIRGKGVPSSHAVNQSESASQHKASSSIFQTMSGRLSSGASKTGNPAIFDLNSKTRILPHGALFEASKRMETTGVYSQGAGLIKLSDGSGWAIIPRPDELEQQHRAYQRATGRDEKGGRASAFEEVGHATVESTPLLVLDTTTPRSISSKWIRISNRTGLVVSCLPTIPTMPDDETSPTSSRGSSAILSNHGSSIAAITSQDSDVTSSVASTFVDAMMFRTPKKKGATDSASAINDSVTGTAQQSEKPKMAPTIPCGMCVEVEAYSSDNKSSEVHMRLVGGQGWVPLLSSGKDLATEMTPPEFRFGSLWFRVQAKRGIKVRLGPSKKAPSIKSEDGVHFRFECGEFLRASEVMTVFAKSGKPAECYAKLYRNRHALLHHGHEEYRSAQSLTVQAEWVQVFSEEELNLEECSSEPRIERHKQGWRYNVVSEMEVPIRKGPSFSAETTGSTLQGGESVVINERVTPAGDKITWLRMKDGDGWLHDVDDQGVDVMLAHSLRHRAKTAVSTKQGPDEDLAYNVIARLFQGEAPNDEARSQRGFNKK